VSEKVAHAPTAADIRDIAAEAAARDPMSLAEIQELADVAVRKARQVELFAARLAELLTGGA
jgi:hypothetical protein